MERSAMDDLLKWKRSKHRNPLIIRGDRQVGKTWLMQEFGRVEYKNTAYVDFENNKRMHSLSHSGLKLPKEVLSCTALLAVRDPLLNI